MILRQPSSQDGSMANYGVESHVAFLFVPHIEWCHPFAHVGYTTMFFHPCLMDMVPIAVSDAGHYSPLNQCRDPHLMIY